MRIYSANQNYRYGYTLPETAARSAGSTIRWYSNPVARDMALATARDNSLMAGLPVSVALGMIAVDECNRG